MPEFSSHIRFIVENEEGIRTGYEFIVPTTDITLEKKDDCYKAYAKDKQFFLDKESYNSLHLIFLGHVTKDNYCKSYLCRLS